MMFSAERSNPFIKERADRSESLREFEVYFVVLQIVSKGCLQSLAWLTEIVADEYELSPRVEMV